MPRLPQPRAGARLEIKKRPLEFSYWPVTRPKPRRGLNSAVFAASPWAVMTGVVNSTLEGNAHVEALAFLGQAQDFYAAARAEGVASNPLILYYAFLNLAKVLVLVKGIESTMVEAKHGLVESRRGSGDEIANARILVIDHAGKKNAFALLLRAMGYVAPPNGHPLEVKELLPQVVIGHRLWREGGGRERFVPIDNIWFMQSAPTRELWLNLIVRKGDLSPFNIQHKQVISEGGLSGHFAQVSAPPGMAPESICFEQLTTLIYPDQPTDQVQSLVDSVKPALWRIATTTPAYRKYYLHLTPAAETSRLPQLGAAYAILFYLGSITRYRPHIFDTLVDGVFGSFLTEFVAAQPEQLLYLLASEICEREIAKPAII